MYTPYLRGKQYELIALRELAPDLKDWNVVPLIEPVRNTFTSLATAMKELASANAPFRIILNPKVGQLTSSEDALLEFLGSDTSFMEHGLPTIALADDADLAALARLANYWTHKPFSILHNGFGDAEALHQLLAKTGQPDLHLFVGDEQELYMRQFRGEARVLIKDGFKLERNADYKPEDPFSDLHEIYQDQGLSGFGDFLTIGDNYSETGGPAYAVAIHLTYFNAYRYNSMYCKHYKSHTNDTPTDPANKFLEAVTNVHNDIANGFDQFTETTALQELLALYERKHFPGLGYVKKLSIKHHIETVGSFLEDADD
ncbi:sce7725 family protein [Yaniella flava]|uniref:Sce7725 family protein n=1 Tax=Yaniella flava TaxID=287930 RepID=A0ABN2UDR0_9MICC